MERDALRADVERALRAAYPDRAEEMVRALEKLGPWGETFLSDKQQLQLRIAMRVPLNALEAQLRPLASTVWAIENVSGAIVQGTEITFCRDFHNLPPNIFKPHGRLPQGVTAALLRIGLVVRCRNPLDLTGWRFKLEIDGVNYLYGLDAATLAAGLTLPIPLVVGDHTDFRGYLKANVPMATNNDYQFGLHLQGVMHAAYSG